ncbi:subtilisin-like protease [Dorcoceras hygrometricum]|uniref:Subtilisin-like protease n=1 Tax=Dorcoceras hygrometricum TaxID=472368 RepID=A0A2Z7AV04_9LAMI|nr:subtilisin-like protease [Dorcoceras hygrometricum]
MGEVSSYQLPSHKEKVSRGNRHFMVDCGRLRQSGPRPDTRLLRQPALEGLTRSARMDSPRQVGQNKFRSDGSTQLGDGFGSGPTGPGPTDEHSVHLHHRDFIVTLLADQIGRIDSVSKTEETPSSACTRRPDEIGADGFSSSSWPEQIPVTRSGGGDGGLV